MEGEQIRRYTNGKILIEINEQWCKGCGICVEFCPKKVLAMNRRGKPEVIDLESCTKCQLCDLRCPDFAITVEEGQNETTLAAGPRVEKKEGDKS